MVTCHIALIMVTCHIAAPANRSGRVIRKCPMMLLLLLLLLLMLLQLLLELCR